MLLKPAAVLTLFMSVLLSGCQSDSEPAGPVSDPKARELLESLSTAEREVVKSDNGFGFGVFSALAREKSGGNLIISPLSVSIALTMAYNGARNSTETAMAEQLGFGGMDRAGVNAFYAKLLPALTAADGNVQLSIANSIWSDAGFEAEPGFLDLNRATFDAETQTLDFADFRTVPVINKWVSTKTSGLIPDIIQAPLSEDLVMLLINALYFKGSWSKPFSPKQTYDGVFHLADGSEKPCRMMMEEADFLSFSDKKVNAVELPYGDSLYSMVFLQPIDPAGIQDLITDLVEGAWEGWQDKFAVRHGLIHVPKFKLEYNQSLAGVLKAMGMEVAFSDAADFTGIRKAGGIRISDVIHKTFVNVDEKGTEAAAVTVVQMRTVSIPVDLLRLDRPFVFAIREKNSGAVLFLGRIMDPVP